MQNAKLSMQNVQCGAAVILHFSMNILHFAIARDRAK
jgi:hypothetical protein